MQLVFRIVQQAKVADCCNSSSFALSEGEMVKNESAFGIYKELKHLILALHCLTSLSQSAFLITEAGRQLCTIYAVPLRC